MGTKTTARNDLINGLKRKIVISKKDNNTAKISSTAFSYNGKYGQGYDGCGCHTHKD